MGTALQTAPFHHVLSLSTGNAAQGSRPTAAARQVEVGAICNKNLSFDTQIRKNISMKPIEHGHQSISENAWLTLTQLIPF